MYCTFMNQMTADCDKKKTMATKRQGGARACRDQGHGGRGEVRGGWPLLAVMKERECITGSCVLYERDREGFTKKEVT